MGSNKGADLTTTGYSRWRSLAASDLDHFLKADLTSAGSFRWLCEITGRTHPAYYRSFRDAEAIYVGVEPWSIRQLGKAVPAVSASIRDEANRLGLRVRTGWLLPGSESGVIAVKDAVKPFAFAQFYVDLQSDLNEIWTRSVPHIDGRPGTASLRSQLERRDAVGERARRTFGDRQAVGSYLDRLAGICRDLRLDFERDSDHPAHVLRKWPLRPVFVAESLAGALAHLLHQRLAASVVTGICSCGRPIVTQPRRGRPAKTCGDNDCQRRLRQGRRARSHQRSLRA
jgi:hypothetical protein